jgi:hypothetical protein
MRRLARVVLLGMLALPGVFAAACSSPDPDPVAATESDDAGEANLTDASIVDANRDVSVDAGAVDADNGQPSSVYPAFPLNDLDLPHVVSSRGAVIAQPKVVVVTFAGDPSAALIDAFNDQLVAGSYWSTTTSEYGIGPLTIAKKVRLAEDPGATLDTAGVQAWVTAHLGAAAPLGASDPSTLYAVYFPATTSILTKGGVSSCAAGPNGFLGYHSELATTKTAFAVIARCPGDAAYTAIDHSMSTASHEYAEWATNPFPRTAPAYDVVSRRQWEVGGYAEVGDLCYNFSPVRFRAAVVGDSGIPGVFQRTWSNASALAAHHPCVPIPT